MKEATLLFGDTHRNLDIFWRTGFLAPDPVIYVEVDGQGTLAVNAMEFGRAAKESRIADVRSFDALGGLEARERGGEDAAYVEVCARLLKEAGVSEVRVDPSFPIGLGRALEDRGLEVVSDAPVFAPLRRSKRPEELDAIQASQSAATSAMTVARDVLAAAEVRDGKLFADGEPLTSARVIVAIQKKLLELGYSTPEGIIVAGGAGAADPHASDTGQLMAGEPVIVDIFPLSNSSRYFGDMTRTFVAGGEPEPAWVRMYNAVRAAHAKALSEVRAGVNGRDVHRAVCQSLYDAGYSTRMEGLRREGVPEMIHGTGHGVGLEIHEVPRVSDIDLVLQEGDVVTIEPGLYSPELGSVRLEDIVVVTADGYRNLTEWPMEWRAG